MSGRALLSFINVHSNGKPTGVMVPKPLHPLHCAKITELGMDQIGYSLIEDTKGDLDVMELERTVTAAKKSCNPRGIVIINPGNPTGQVLPRNSMEKIIRFAHKEKLLLIADEIYQDNVYSETIQFHSFKKVLMEMGPPYSHMQLGSIMSLSKGYTNECGLRGGFVETLNFDEDVRIVLGIYMATFTCPNIFGQIGIDCLVNPPRENDPSYVQYTQEKMNILQSVKDKAKITTDALNSFPGVSCKQVQGAVYAFPEMKLPLKAIKQATSIGECPSYFYCRKAFERTGICLAPWSDGERNSETYHFRISFLLPIEKLKKALQELRSFHDEFMKEYE